MVTLSRRGYREIQIGIHVQWPTHLKCWPPRASLSSYMLFNWCFLIISAVHFICSQIFKSPWIVSNDKKKKIALLSNTQPLKYSPINLTRPGLEMLANPHFKCGVKISKHIFRVGSGVLLETSRSKTETVAVKVGLDWTPWWTSAWVVPPSLVCFGLGPSPEFEWNNKSPKQIAPGLWHLSCRLLDPSRCFLAFLPPSLT